jgi:hypothetical protein
MRDFFRASHFGLLLCLLLACRSAGAYSVLTHEQLIDLTWQSSIVPLLRSRYPGITAEQLEQARSYAYAGCVIQDIGYYPFGNQFVSDLTHYVRSGDFIVHLFRDAKDANQLAFAVGALSHYIGDNIGHSMATNHAVRNMARLLRTVRINMLTCRRSSRSTSTRLRTAAWRRFTTFATSASTFLPSN